jgi:hypothetical protein
MHHTEASGNSRRHHRRHHRRQAVQGVGVSQSLGTVEVEVKPVTPRGS